MKFYTTKHDVRTHRKNQKQNQTIPEKKKQSMNWKLTYTSLLCECVRFFFFFGTWSNKCVCFADQYQSAHQLTNWAANSTSSKILRVLHPFSQQQQPKNKFFLEIRVLAGPRIHVNFVYGKRCDYTNMFTVLHISSICFLIFPLTEAFFPILQFMIVNQHCANIWYDCIVVCLMVVVVGVVMWVVRAFDCVVYLFFSFLLSHLS